MGGFFLDDNVTKILNQLNQGKINCKKAITLINRKDRKIKPIKKSSKIKI